MDQNQQTPDGKPKRVTGGVSGGQRITNLALVGLAGQAGCVTLFIVFAALLIGLWLDSQFGRRGPCTIGLLVLSVPFSLYAMLRVALGTINRISPQPSQAKTKRKRGSTDLTDKTTEEV
jgi:hypothetical protein